MSADRAKSLADTIDVDPKRPLLIVDADEVLFHFMAAFHAYIDELGHAFVYRSYALSGNVLDKPGGEPLARETVTGLVQDFFHARTREMPADPEAAFEPRFQVTNQEGVADFGKLPQSFVRVQVVGNNCPRVDAVIGGTAGKFREANPSRHYLSMKQTDSEIQLTFTLSPPMPVRRRRKSP